MESVVNMMGTASDEPMTKMTDELNLLSLTDHVDGSEGGGGSDSSPNVQRQSGVAPLEAGSSHTAAYVGDIDETSNADPESETVAIATDFVPTTTDASDPLGSPCQVNVGALVPSESIVDPPSHPTMAFNPTPEPAVAVSPTDAATHTTLNEDSMLDKFSRLTTQAQEIKAVATPNKATHSSKSTSPPKPTHQATPKRDSPNRVNASPHYTLPKDTAGSRSKSQESRDLYECSKKFKALPLPPLPKGHPVTLKSHTARSSLPPPSRFMRGMATDFKARPMPDFKAAHARAIVVRSHKPLTRPVPFSFLTEQRSQARRGGLGSMLSLGLSTFSLPLSRATSGSRSAVTPNRAKPVTVTPPRRTTASSQGSTPKSTVTTTESSSSPTDQDSLHELVHTAEMQQAELLDRLLTDSGEEGEVTFESMHDPDAEALDELLDGPEDGPTDPSLYSSPMKSTAAIDQRSPDDVQTMHL